MTELPGKLDDVLGEIKESLGEILRQQKTLGDRMESLENRFGQHEMTKETDDASQGVSYDYRILEHLRRYTIHDSKGHRAEMISTRRCLALRDLPELRTRYHTGTGNREVEYAYRLVGESQGGDSGWTPLDFSINKGAGADFSAIFSLPRPILSGELFELRHEIELIDSFNTHNEWVSMVMEYPTGRFTLEVILPADRMILGTRREISEGASQSFDKRRLVPQKVPGQNQVSLVWTEENPVTGRTYTVYWEW
ncbi:MAG: hypothetical protein QF919_11255 [Nitrospinota bacterium]|jgi:hypothetical protein|nr:hypothetical protein [Nitrospinota bacterium]